MLYDLFVQSNINSKKNLCFKNAELQMMKDSHGTAILYVKDQLRNHKPIQIPSIPKVYSGKEPDSFCFMSNVLKASVKIIPSDHSMNDPIKTILCQIRDGTYSTENLAEFKGKISGVVASPRAPIVMEKKDIVTRNTSDMEEQKSARGSTTGVTSELGERKPIVPIPIPSPVSSRKLYDFEKQPSVNYTPVFKPVTSPWEERARKVSKFPGYSSNNSSRFYSNTHSNRYAPYTPPSKNDVEGFKNLGQTCYMSACIQLLYHSFIRDQILGYRDKMLPQLGSNSVFEGFAELFERKLEKKSADLTTIQYRIQQQSKKFRDYNQEDAHEFLLVCLDLLSFEPSIENSENLDEQRSLALQKLDPVASTFKLQISHVVECPTGDYRNVFTESFTDLSIPLPPSSSSKPISLVELLKTFFKTEIVEWSCETCPSKQAQISHSVKTLPKNILLHLKRFEVGQNFVKRHDEVDAPLELSMKEFVSPEHRDQDCKYTLSGVILHSGSGMQSGHYEFIRREKNLTWTSFNDALVTRDLVDFYSSRRDQGYIFLYSRVPS